VRPHAQNDVETEREKVVIETAERVRKMIVKVAVRVMEMTRMNETMVTLAETVAKVEKSQMSQMSQMSQIEMMMEP